MHLVLLLWARGDRDKMKKVLALSGFGIKDAFYRVAQAVSETLPNESKEKKFLDGFLTGRDKIVSEIKDIMEQMKLF